MNMQQQIGAGLMGFSILLIVILSFVKADLDRQGAFLCEAVSDNPAISMEDCPAHNDKTSWLVIAAFGLAFLILGAGAYLAFAPKQQAQQKKEFAEVDESKLDEDEKKVYGLLKSSNGASYQTDLIKGTGYSKVKVTRILDRMESKGILERKRRGMTNIIVLK